MQSYNNYNYNSNPQDKKIKELEQDKEHLTQAIEDLNACYQEKIYLLEQTISQQQLKYEEVLEWKQDHIDKSIFDVERYEVEIKKMIQILDTAHTNFEQEKEGLLQEVNSQKDINRELKEANDALREFNNQNEGKIQEMVITYTEEIQKLKQELRQLREESMVSESSSQALREVTNSQNTQNMEPNSTITIQGGKPAESKVSIDTVMSQ